MVFLRFLLFSSCRLVRDDLVQLLGEPLVEPPLDPRPQEPQIMPAVEALREADQAYQRSRRRIDELRAQKILTAAPPGSIELGQLQRQLAGGA